MKPAKNVFSIPKLSSTQASQNRREGLRLYQLAGRPTQAEIKAVFGPEGVKWTWERRAKELGLRSAEKAAARFQSLLAKKRK